MYSGTAGEVELQESNRCKRFVAGARSSIALAKMLHADAYIVACITNVGNPSNGPYKHDMVGDGIIQVVTRIGMFCCETRQQNESRRRLNILSGVILRIERY